MRNDHVVLLFIAFSDRSTIIHVLYRGTRLGGEAFMNDTPPVHNHNYDKEPVEGWMTLQPYSEFATYGLLAPREGETHHARPHVCR